MLRSEKTQLIDKLETIYRENSAVIVTHYHGLTVSNITNLRNSLSEVGATLLVTKNTLAKIAANNIGVSGFDQYLSGPVALCYSKDPVSAAKNLVEFSKKNQSLKIVGGLIDNNACDEAVINQLSKLPSLNELRSTIIGLINAPATKIARITSVPAEQLARVLKAYSEK